MRLILYKQEHDNAGRWMQYYEIEKNFNFQTLFLNRVCRQSKAYGAS